MMKTITAAACLAAISTTHAQQIVRDTNTGTSHAFPTAGSISFTALDRDIVLFAADSPARGYELWRSDGTALGTTLVKDIKLLGSGMLASGPMVTSSGIAYFPADNGTSGMELWRSDGTAAGTQLVVDLIPGAVGGLASTLELVVDSIGRLWFAADNGTSGVELFVSDGTAANTLLASDIWPGATSSSPTNFTIYGNQVFFVATQAFFGAEPFVSDGVTTSRVVDVWPGMQSGGALEPVVFDSRMFFTGNNGTYGHELWGTSGASAVMVKDTWPGAVAGIPSFKTVSQDLLCFAATDSTKGTELWTSNGSTVGTQRLIDINPGSASSAPSYLVDACDELFFSADDGTSGRELWSSTGVAQNTTVIKDINPGSGGSDPQSITAAGSGRDVVFSADDGQNGRELWFSDGTAAGTVMLKDIAPGAASSNPREFRQVGSTIYFIADDPLYGAELFQMTVAQSGGCLAEPFGVGWPGTLGITPEIDKFFPFLPKVGGPPFRPRMTKALPSAPAVLHIGAPTPPLALGSCLAWVPAPILTIPGVVDGSGNLFVTLTFPNPAWKGIELYVQYLVFDPQASCPGVPGLSASDPMHVVIN